MKTMMITKSSNHDNKFCSRFQEIHREACLLLQIHRPTYRKRKLKSNALVLAMFMMLELEVEESEDENIKKLFVEVFGDRDLFL